MAFRNQLGLTVNPYNGEIWAAEQGTNGGDATSGWTYTVAIR